MVAMQPTLRFTRGVCAAMEPNSGMNSSRGLLKILSPTQAAAMAPVIHFACESTLLALQSVLLTPASLFFKDSANSRKYSSCSFGV